MPCGCKQQVKQSKPQIIRDVDVMEIREPAKPDYTREELNRALNYSRGVTNSAEERKYTINFHNKHFSEQLVPHCSTCWERVKTRLDHLDNKLNFYEQYEASRKTEDNPQ